VTKYRIAKEQRYTDLKQREKSYFDLEMLRTLPEKNLVKNCRLLEKSQSQIRQDIFVLSELNYKKNGFFVEFGATNGVDLNNTYLLATEFGWDGILAEPDRRWHSDLKKNRNCIIDTRCVSDQSGVNISFTALPRGENSGISKVVPLRRRIRGRRYDVESVSFNDLLAEHNAPNIIDYASVDTEGSESLIMDALDFSRWKFRIITIEHNFEPRREHMYNLMIQNGYKRIYPELSRFDDWFVHTDLQDQ
jgi:FkbM family methyltransferase